jgi:hypothetical protein
MSNCASVSYNSLDSAQKSPTSSERAETELAQYSLDVYYIRVTFPPMKCVLYCYNAYSILPY